MYIRHYKTYFKRYKMVPHKGGVGQSEIDIPPKMDGSD